MKCGKWNNNKWGRTKLFKNGVPWNPLILYFKFAKKNI